MDINKLKSTWKDSGRATKNEPELQAMMKIRNHPMVRRTKAKFLTEMAGLAVLLATYYDILDAADKPVWLNVALIASVLFYMGSGIIGYFTLLNPVLGADVVHSLKSFKSKLTRMLALAMIASTAFGVSLMLFLTYNIEFTPGKYVLLSGMIATFAIMTIISYKTWQGRVVRIREAVRALEL